MPKWKARMSHPEPLPLAFIEGRGGDERAGHAMIDVSAANVRVAAEKAKDKFPEGTVDMMYKVGSPELDELTKAGDDAAKHIGDQTPVQVK